MPVWPVPFTGPFGATAGLILKTVAEMQALQLAGTILPGRFYLITDAPGDSQIIVQGFSVNEIGQGIRRMLCPADYDSHVDGSGNDWIGVWNPGKAVSAGQLAIWGGLVWQNTTGSIGAEDDLSQLNGTDWTLIPKASFTNNEYIPMIFGCIYDLVNNWVARQWDDSGNIFGVDFITDQGFYGFSSGSFAMLTNMIDVSDWNYSTSGYRFTNNTCLAVFNNCNGPIYDNSNTGMIWYNSNDGSIARNSNKGDIHLNVHNGDLNDNSNFGRIDSNNNLSNIRLNSNGGQIFANTNGGLIEGNSNEGEISTNSNTFNIQNNSNNGRITLNVSPVVHIQFNSNLGPIESNSNSGDISQNSNCGSIDNNSNNGSIAFNTNGGNISSNSNNGWVAENSNNGVISGNSNGNTIEWNSNAGHITSNSNTGRIFSNKNNGFIGSIGAGNSAIEFNINNGFITTTTAGIISDAQVNK